MTQVIQKKIDNVDFTTLFLLSLQKLVIQTYFNEISRYKKAYGTNSKNSMYQ